MNTIFDRAGQEEPLPVVSTLSELGQAALKYASKGWHVFPCEPEGKAPLLQYGQNGATTDPEIIERWWRASPRANIGLHLAPSGLLAVDVDSYKGEAVTAGELPPTLTQISARGGTHAVYRAEPGVKYWRGASQNVDVKHRGYVLVEPSSFEGGTYRWANDAKPAPAPAWTVRPKIDRTKQSQDSSGRTLAEAEEALRHIDPDVPYDDWLKVLMALHQGFGFEALTLAEEWTERFLDPTHAHRTEQVEYKFSSFDDSGPDGVTIAHVFHKAKEAGADLGQLAEKHRQQALLQQFGPAPEQISAKSIFETQAELEAEEDPDVYPLLQISDLAKRPPPVFLIGRHVPQGGLGFIVAAPGVGKTFLALDMALTVAAGLNHWQGEHVSPAGDGSVLYIASEGSFDLPLRVEAWKQANGVTHEIPNFYVLEASVNFMDSASVNKLVRSVSQLDLKPAIVIVDTVSRALPGADENAQKDMTLFITACEALQHRFGSAVIGLHHTAKAGGIRGSSVLEGAGDFIITMEREKGEEVGTLTMYKQKAAEDGWSYPFELQRQTINLDKPLPEGLAQWQSLIFAKTHFPVPEDTARQAQRAAHHTTADQTERYPLEKVLDAMRLAWLDSKPWSKEPRAKGRYAVQLMQEQFGIPRAIAKAALDQWLASGRIQSRVQSSDTKRPGLYVSPTYVEEANTDVFG